ncbi:MAG: hypothetical protein KIT09_10120 [Bryobacteraceae bacterium]|nr:hypothetical protein [Bryobacteraceae bacterium]
MAGAAFLLALNASICRDLFVTEYTRHMGSIEGAYIGLSRYILQRPFEFGWFPLWYCGIPFQNAYPPLLHYVAAAAWAGGVSPALAYHAVAAVFYALGPVTIFVFAVALSGDRLASFSAAAGYSLISPSIFMAESVRAWAAPAWTPARLRSLVEYGDGPHVAALTLLPLALIALDRVWRNGGFARLYLAAVAAAAVVLTNWVGAFGLALAAASYILARSIEPGWPRRAAVLAASAVVAYALAAPWLPPSTVGRIRYNSQNVIGEYPFTWAHAACAVLLLLAGAGLRAALRRGGVSLVPRFASFFFLLTGAIVLTDSWFGLPLVPRPHRYHLEMEMAFCLLAAFIVTPFLARLRLRYKFVVAIVAIALAATQFGNYRLSARWMTETVDISGTFEYRASVWLQRNLSHARVFTSGSLQFWLNAFADTPQVGGGFAPGIANPQIPIVHFGVPWTVADSEASAMWLRLYGAQAVAVSGPGGRDAYKEAWRDPKKFDGVLPELWREGGDVIYAVPQRSSSLAHVVRPEHVAQRSPSHNADVEPVRALAAALEDPSLPEAAFAWEGPSRARIRATLLPSQLLFIQVSHHPGWSAFSGTAERAIRRDSLGFMIIEPDCVGDCEVTLRYDGGWESAFARTAFALALIGGLATFLTRLRRRG